MQIGITVATILAAAIGAATVAPRVAQSWIELGMAENAADPLALVGDHPVIAFLLLVLGELAPKRSGLQRSEGIALAASWSAGRPGPAVPAAGLAARRASAWSSGCSGGNPKASGEVMSPDELRSLVLAHESLTVRSSAG